MTEGPRLPVAIIGSGNIGTDLMIKVLRTSRFLRMGALVGIDPASDGLARARDLDVPVTDRGIDGLIEMPEFKDIRLAFDATSAGAHGRHDEVLSEHGVQVIDLTPAAIGPYVVPVVNLDEHLGAPNLNMVTCGGQATIPIVAAIARIATVHYAEIHGAWSRGRRRRPPRKGHHRPQPGGAAADHARYGNHAGGGGR
jgi:acetaldehyde dehydrogenase